METMVVGAGKFMDMLSKMLLVLGSWMLVLDARADVPIGEPNTSYMSCGTITSVASLAASKIKFIGRARAINENERFSNFSVRFEVMQVIGEPDSNYANEVITLNFVTKSPVELFENPFIVGRTYLVFADDLILDVCNGVFTYADFLLSVLQSVSLELGASQERAFDSSDVCQHIDAQQLSSGEYRITSGIVLSLTASSSIMELALSAGDSIAPETYFVEQRWVPDNLIGKHIFLVHDQNNFVSTCLISDLSSRPLNPISSAMFAYLDFWETSNNNDLDRHSRK